MTAHGEEPNALYPGQPAILDGSGAVVWVETAIAQAACVYPITPSTKFGLSFV
jgi:hypothetical protein